MRALFVSTEGTFATLTRFFRLLITPICRAFRWVCWPWCRSRVFHDWCAFMDSRLLGNDKERSITTRSWVPVLTSHTLTTRYHLSCVVFVADRGLFSEDNLQILDQSGLEYVVGAKLKTQARVIKGENSFTRSLPRAEWGYKLSDNWPGRKAQTGGELQ